MEKEFKKSSGICLLLGSLLATITMAMHPMGGDIQHIAKIGHVLMFSHSVAIICMPFVGFGFWGLSVLLQTQSKVSMLSFFIFCFGLFAAMIAATINGLALPIFASNYSSITGDAAIAKTVLAYGSYINFSMTTIFIVAAAISIAIWSVLIIRLAQLPKWVGYYGLVIVAFGIVGIFLKFNFTNLFGFRVFVAGLVSWKIIAGFALLQKGRK
jgi:hypothetical protein